MHDRDEIWLTPADTLEAFIDYETCKRSIQTLHEKVPLGEVRAKCVGR